MSHRIDILEAERTCAQPPSVYLDQDSGPRNCSPIIQRGSPIRSRTPHGSSSALATSLSSRAVGIFPWHAGIYPRAVRCPLQYRQSATVSQLTPSNYTCNIKSKIVFYVPRSDFGPTNRHLTSIRLCKGVVMLEAMTVLEKPCTYLP